jgi:hypothetical protein
MNTDINALLVVTCLALTIGNLIVLGLNLKLYTEIFKARDQRR